MTQLDPSRYKRLSRSSPTYGQSDGLYWDATNSQLVLVISDAVVARVDTTGITADLEFSGEIRGDLLRRGATAWESFAAKDAGKIVCGNGTDVTATTLSGDATISSGVITVTDVTVGSDAAGDMLYKSSGTALARLAKGTAGQALLMNAGATAPSWATIGTDATLAATGALTLANPQRLLSSTVNLTADTIVGTDAGDIGHAAGVTLVAAVASKVIAVESIVITYTYATAAYTDGGNIGAIYAGGAACTGVIAAASSLGSGANNVVLLKPVGGVALVNTAVALTSSAGFTQPGTAAGTATVKTYYRLIDA